ncbi:hypothetical protein COB64_04430 [Candidatus Wolfebacteria bacterium]|nr:MAG: hypothetical protein COB64_04430 [Candidatus Wolfebacteria bacterium]
MDEDRNDPKRQALAQAFFGTCAGPDYAPGVSFNPKDEENREPTVIWGRCTHCSDEKKILIRNRTTQGMYLITKKEAYEFAKIGKFELPTDEPLIKYIIVATTCNFCRESNNAKSNAKLMKRSDFTLPNSY